MSPMNKIARFSGSICPADWIIEGDTDGMSSLHITAQLSLFKTLPSYNLEIVLYCVFVFLFKNNYLGQQRRAKYGKWAGVLSQICSLIPRFRQFDCVIRDRVLADTKPYRFSDTCTLLSNAAGGRVRSVCKRFVVSSPTWSSRSG